MFYHNTNFKGGSVFRGRVNKKRFLENRKKQQEEAHKRYLANLKKKEEQDAKTVDLYYKSGLFKKFTDDELKKEEEDGRSSRTGADYQIWLKGNKKFASANNKLKLQILGIMKQGTNTIEIVQFCEKNNIRNKDFYLDMAEVKRIMNVFQMLIPVQIDKGIMLSRMESNPPIDVPSNFDITKFRTMYEFMGSRHPKMQKLCRDQQKEIRALKATVAFFFKKNFKK